MNLLARIVENTVGPERTHELIKSYQAIVYKSIIQRNKLKYIFKKKKDPTFLFILSPPYCGSTMLNHLISSSPNVSVNNVFDSREGQQLPVVRDIIFNNKQRWEYQTEFDWKVIKAEWMKYWDLTKPILLEKSPCNIMRAEKIKPAFEPAYFLILHRNPYAHCEGIIRRNKWSPQKAARFSMKCLNAQRSNIKSLENCLSISYEGLSGDPKAISGKIENWLPLLGKLKHDQIMRVQNVRGTDLPITNLNQEKIKNLTNEQLIELNKVFENRPGIFKFFNYRIIRPK